MTKSTTNSPYSTSSMGCNYHYLYTKKIKP